MTLKKNLALLAAASVIVLPTHSALADAANIFAPEQVREMADDGRLTLLSHDADEVVLRRAWLPASQELPPHGQVAEGKTIVVTLLAGELEFAMGDTFDESKLQKLPLGSVFVLTHDNATHFARTGPDGAQLLLAESFNRDISPQLTTGRQ